MKFPNIKNFAGFMAVLLSAGALLIPYAQEQKRDNIQAAELPEITQNTISDDYQNSGLFDSQNMHVINFQISQENWNAMISHATEEKYVSCDVEIDGEVIKNIALRPKGNSSLTSISQQGSEHFSFKIEFDHYDQTVTYHGLDKLCLNNLGQDPSCMKDFMAYHLMNDMGVAAPLSSYALMQVNGQDFGLYLAVEAVEDSFCYRNYGENASIQLYKPDCFSMDSLDISAMMDYEEGSSLWKTEQIMDGSFYADSESGDRADILGEMLKSVFTPEQTAVAALQYVGEEPENYEALWNTAVCKPQKADRTRLINSVKILNSDNPEPVLDSDSLLRYFAVHNFVNNYDGYTSMFVHNFYLCEQDGKFSMIPWDYNLAFGSFTYESAVSSILNPEEFNPVPDTGNAMSPEISMINYPIDTPVYSVALSDRPLLNALLSNPEYLEEYHKIYDELLKKYFENGAYQKLYTQIHAMLQPYVEKNLTFYRPEQFENGAEAMRNYLNYRSESIRRQLEGDLPSTLEGQKQHSENLVIPENLNLSDLADFAALLPELNSDLIMNILHVFLQDDYAYTAKGAVSAVHDYLAHPLQLAGRIPPLMKIPYIRNLVIQKAAPFLIGMALLTAGIAVTVSIIKKRRYSDDYQ